jgi:DNA-binding transcriptional regulator YiaG
MWEVNYTDEFGGKQMIHKFSELEAKMSPERRARIAEEVEKTLAEMPLHELRNARGFSQQMLAEALNVQQPAIAKLEKRTICIFPRCAVT